MAANDIIIPGPLPVRVTNFKDAPQVLEYEAAIPIGTKVEYFKVTSPCPILVGDYVFRKGHQKNYHRVNTVIHREDGSLALILDEKNQANWP